MYYEKAGSWWDHDGVACASLSRQRRSMYRLRVLGGALLEGPSGPVSGRVARGRQLALLALLAASRESGLSRDKLIGYLWPESPHTKARHLLSDSHYQLRRALTDDVLLVAGDVLRLNPDIMWCDVAAFEEALERGDLEAAVSLYGGPLLDGFYLGGLHEGFEEWLDQARERLARAFRRALEELAEGAEAVGDFGTAASWWCRLSAADPYNTQAVVKWVEALAAVGERAKALQILLGHEELVKRELGVEAGSELKNLADQLRHEDRNVELGVAADGGTSGAAAPVAASLARTSRTPGRTFHRRKTSAVALIVIAAGVALAAVRLMVGRLSDKGGTMREGDARVAVFPFSYRGSDEFAYLGGGMAPLLSATLESAGIVRTADPQAVRGRLERAAADETDVDLHRRIARERGASRYVIGEIVEVDGRLRITARLITPAADGDGVVQFQVEGGPGDFFTLVDALATDLLIRGFGTESRLTRRAAETTSSLAAFKWYLEGEQAYRAEDLRAARLAFGRALELDSTFALAWYRLSNVLSFGTYDEWDAAIRAAEQAVRNSSRLTQREILVLRAFRALLNGSGEEAERLYRGVLSEYPHDVEAWKGLVWVLHAWNPLRGRSTKGARDAALRALREDPGQWENLEEVFLLEAIVEDWAALDSLLSQHFVQLAPLRWRAVSACVGGDQRQRDRVRRDLRIVGQSAPWTPLYAGWLGRDLDEAISLARILAARAESDEATSLAQYWVALFELSRGRWRAALDELALVHDLHPTWRLDYRALWSAARFIPLDTASCRALHHSLSWWEPPPAATREPGDTWPARFMTYVHGVARAQIRLYLLGRLSLRLGDDEAALRYAENLEGTEPAAGAGSLSRDLGASLRAHVQWSRHNPGGALAALEAQEFRVRTPWFQQAPFFALPDDLLLRGDILRELGRLEEALMWYGALGAKPYDLPYLAISHLRRAETYEQLGNDERARAHYSRFIQLWEDCDPELRPLVNDAVAALARLSEPAD